MAKYRKYKSKWGYRFRHLFHKDGWIIIGQVILIAVLSIVTKNNI